MIVFCASYIDSKNRNGEYQYLSSSKSYNYSSLPDNPFQFHRINKEKHLQVNVNEYLFKLYGKQSDAHETFRIFDKQGEPITIYYYKIEEGNLCPICFKYKDIIYYIKDFKNDIKIMMLDNHAQDKHITNDQCPVHMFAGYPFAFHDINNSNTKISDTIVFFQMKNDVATVLQSKLDLIISQKDGNVHKYFHIKFTDIKSLLTSHPEYLLINPHHQAPVPKYTSEAGNTYYKLLDYQNGSQNETIYIDERAFTPSYVQRTEIKNIYQINFDPNQSIKQYIYLPPDHDPNDPEPEIPLNTLYHIQEKNDHVTIKEYDFSVSDPSKVIQCIEYNMPNIQKYCDTLVRIFDKVIF